VRTVLASAPDDTLNYKGWQHLAARWSSWYPN